MENLFGLPSWEQKNEEISILREIAGKMGVVGTVGSWSDVQSIVRRGQAERYFAIGDSFMTTYRSIPVILDIIGINHDTPTDTARPYSITVQFRDCLENVQFDAPEPTNPDANIKLYGNNNYMQSAIKQWLNSNETTFKWVSKSQYDVAPTSANYNGAGFLKLLDPELVSVIGAVNKQVARNTITDGGGQDLFSDKIFLLSRTEVYAGVEGVTTGENPYAYYSALAGAPTTGALAGRIKLLNNSPRNWWLRSPNVGNSNNVRYVSLAGEVSNSARNSFGISPACCII